MSINELESKARELRQLQALIEEAQQEAEAIKDAIKAARRRLTKRQIVVHTVIQPTVCCFSTAVWYNKI